MAEISKTYEPQSVESKWYAHWLQKGFFKSTPNPNKEPFTIVMPPPNVTGVLHMGHMLNNTIQDVLIRKARMQGKEACWVPGTDHASIATESKVVALLKEKGLTKEQVGRDEFLKHAFEWKEKYGGIILDQLKRLGASCDWDRTRFTMENDLSDAVIESFVKLHEKGLIYRGIRMVNWDPVGKTAVSDEEVIHKEVNSKLYYINYKIDGSNEAVTIATTRPETILADTAICVNPNDKRYTHLHGKHALVPFINRKIPIITDDYVDIEFGTGCLKITPAHDINDYEIGMKHNLEVIDIIDDEGKLNNKAIKYIGEDRFKARKLIAKDLEEIGQLVKIEELKNKVGYSERTNAVIEPKLSAQWFLKMTEIAQPALKNVENDTIKFHPPKFKNLYRAWMQDVKDWCISRQLWWGQQIPAYYLPNGEVVVAKTAQEALQKALTINKNLTLNDLTQDEDVLDTWFSSWLWPISVFDGFKDPANNNFNYYYPTSTLVTGFDIIFFWVARMIIAGYEFKGNLPFKDVYFTGMVRDEKGRKMSKSLGNSPDPLLLMDKYGTDGVRFGMLVTAPSGNDLLFDEKLCEQGRNFSNKIWNAFRLIKSWEVNEKLPNINQKAIDWIEERINEVLFEIEDLFSKYRLSEALMSIYKLIWDDFCSWYLEMIKPEFGKPIDKYAQNASLLLIEKLMKIIHPFMPFISEEVWHHIKNRNDKDCIIVANWPEKTNNKTTLLDEIRTAKDVITQIRNIRNQNEISPKEKLDLYIKTKNEKHFNNTIKIIEKLANTQKIQFTTKNIEQSKSFLIGTDEFFIPIEIDAAQEKTKIEEEITYLKGFLNAVNKKLSNEKFVNGAPKKVVEIEEKKKEDAESKIKTLVEALANLS